MGSSAGASVVVVVIVVSSVVFFVVVTEGIVSHRQSPLSSGGWEASQT